MNDFEMVHARNVAREGIVERILIKDILSDTYLGKPVTVCGWVRSRRESKGFAFLVLNDGSTQETLAARHQWRGACISTASIAAIPALLFRQRAY